MDKTSMVDIYGNHLQYQGFKPVSQLCAEDIGCYITWGKEGPQQNLRILHSLKIQNSQVVQIIFQYRYIGSVTTTTEVSSVEPVYLWKKVPPPEKTHKEFKFTDNQGQVILQADISEKTAQSIHKDIPTAKIEYREVEIEYRGFGQWKEYNLE